MLKLKDAVPSLIEALNDENFSVQGQAAQALGAIGDKAAVMPLIERLNDSSDMVQQYVCWALGDLKDVRAVKYIIEKLKSTPVRDAAAKALRKIDGEYN